MPEELYSENESLDRIYRLLKGEAVPEAANSLTPAVRPTNESLSGIAELLAGTLEGEIPTLPVGMDAYGEIFTSIVNTAGSTLSSGTWVAVPYAGDGEYRNTTPDHTNDRISIADKGHYLVCYKVDFAGTKDAEYSFALYQGPTVLSQSYTHITLRASGTYHSINCVTLTDVTTANTLMQAIVRSSTHGANFAVKSGQLLVKKI